MAQKPHNSPKFEKKYITERIKIEKLIPGGQALATLADGKKIFLWNALPGETIARAELTKSKSHYLEGIAIEIAEASRERIAPRDECYLATSPWQILAYDYELAEKTELIREIFRQHQIEVNPEPIQTDGRDFGYRNKMEYALYFDHDDEKIHPAFHARGSHRKLPIASSSIERPEIFRAAEETVSRLNSEHANAWDYQSLLLRANQAGQVSGGLYRNRQPHPEFPSLTDTILGQDYSYSPNGFFQINLPVYEMALQAMKPWVKTSKVLDLYAGVGTIGLSIARERQLTLVECDRSAYQEMVKNCEAASTNIWKPQPVLAKSETALEYITPDQTVILDPPRAGCHAALIEKLLETVPRTIIYLSCNPATQARDVKMLLDEQYEIASIQPFNFFPRTPHLENLVVLQAK